MRLTLLVIVSATVLAGCAPRRHFQDVAALQQQVVKAERDFARSMADRNHAAFSAMLAPEAVFFTGDTPVRGSAAVAAEWKPFFEGADPPFAWEPDRVEVLESGTLAISTGPVYNREGKVIGRFNSIWRRESSGRWKVVFDKGSPVCTS